MVSIIQAVILSIIQAITEWLPISSSGHLALIQNLFGFQNIAYDVFLHFASILAVIWVFRKDIVKLLKLNDKKNRIYLTYLLIAIIPIALVGLFFKEIIEATFSSMFFLGIFFMISGIIVSSTKFVKEKRGKLNFADSVFIGLFQIISILPGISRSGTTISAALFKGIKREQAIRFSFLMAIPLILGVSIIEAKDLVLSDINLTILLISFILTFLTSILAIRLLLSIIRKQKFWLFGLYNLILGILILILT